MNFELTWQQYSTVLGYGWIGGRDFSENATEKNLKQERVWAKLGPQLGDTEKNTKQAYIGRFHSMVGHPSCDGHGNTRTSYDICCVAVLRFVFLVV